MPLFVIGAVAFGVSYLAFRMIVEGPGHLPVWSLFTATGAILCAGGTAVLVAGGEEPLDDSPFFDSDRFVLLPREEYDELRATRATPAPESRRPVARVEAPPAAPMPTVPLGASGEAPFVWDESPTPAEPTSRLRSASALDAALREVESVLASLAEPNPESDRRSRALAAATPQAEAPVVAPAPAARVSERPEPPARGAHRRSSEPSAAAGVCTSCGTRIDGVAAARHCSACDEPLCAACAARADYEGHAELCPRCHGLLALSHGEDDASGPL